MTEHLTTEGCEHQPHDDEGIECFDHCIRPAVIAFLSAVVIVAVVMGVRG